MEVIEASNNEIIWQVIECPHAKEWVGTFIKFELSTNEGKTKVLFTHEGWEEQSEFYAHCSFSWAYYLMSLRDLVETGKGKPFTPNEEMIEN